MEMSFGVEQAHNALSVRQKNLIDNIETILESNSVDITKIENKQKEAIMDKL